MAVITTNLYIRTRFMKSWVYICPPWSTKYGSVQSTSHYFNCLSFIPSPIIFPHFTHAFSIAKLSPVVIWSHTVPLYGNSLTWKQGRLYRTTCPGRKSSWGPPSLFFCLKPRFFQKKILKKSLFSFVVGPPFSLGPLAAARVARL